MRALTRCVTSLWIVVLWGCDPGRPLAELTAPSLVVRLPGLEEQKWPESLAIYLSDGGEGCPDLSSRTEAFFNDTEVPMTTAGHFKERGSFPIATPESCVSTVFVTGADDLPSNLRDEVTRIRLEEGDTTFHAEAFLVCTPRSITMTAPADGVLRSGDEVELEWQPATDVLSPGNVWLRGTGFAVQLAGSSGGTVRVEGNRLRLRIPQLPAGAKGAANLQVFGHPRTGLYQPQVTRCEGFAECLFWCGAPPHPTASVPVTVQAP